MLSCVWSTHDKQHDWIFFLFFFLKKIHIFFYKLKKEINEIRKRRKKEGEKVGKIKAEKMPLLKHKTNEMKEIESFER